MQIQASLILNEMEGHKGQGAGNNVSERTPLIAPVEVVGCNCF